MPTYAIVETGGKQYRAEKGGFLLVDRIAEDEGAKVGLRPVMFRSDDDTVLAPKDLEKVKVEAKVAGHERGEKIKVFKYKAKKGYRKRQGHRSELTRLEVTEVSLLTRKPAAGAKKDEVAEEKPKAAPKKAAAKEPEAEKKVAAKKAPAKKPAAKSETKPAAKKPAAKKPAAKKPAAKKPAAKSDAKPAAKKKKPAAKKPAAKKPAAKKESD